MRASCSNKLTSAVLPSYISLLMIFLRLAMFERELIRARDSESSSSTAMQVLSQKLRDVEQEASD